MVDFKDYYKLLGISKTASEKEIKAAYRKLARKFHPDVNRGDAKAEARFKEINEANEVLSDPEKRRRYDELGSDWKSYSNAPPGGGQRSPFEGDPGGFSDFFNTFFAGRAAAGRQSPGFGGAGRVNLEDLFGQAHGRGAAPEAPATPVELTLEEIAQGTTRTLRIDVGHRSHREIEVKIPAGIKDGAKVRVPSGQGDVYLVVKTLKHPHFERQEDDLRTSVPVKLTLAMLGGEVEVPTLTGRVGIKVPAHTPNGRTFRIKGQGLPRREGGHGDLMASLVVELPKSLGHREKELFEELRRLGH